MSLISLPLLLWNYGGLIRAFLLMGINLYVSLGKDLSGQRRRIVCGWEEGSRLVFQPLFLHILSYPGSLPTTFTTIILSYLVSQQEKQMSFQQGGAQANVQRETSGEWSKPWPLPPSLGSPRSLQFPKRHNKEYFWIWEWCSLIIESLWWIWICLPSRKINVLFYFW